MDLKLWLGLFNMGAVLRVRCSKRWRKIKSQEDLIKIIKEGRTFIMKESECPNKCPYKYEWGDAGISFVCIRCPLKERCLKENENGKKV